MEVDDECMVERENVARVLCGIGDGHVDWVQCIGIVEWVVWWHIQ